MCAFDKVLVRFLMLIFSHILSNLYKEKFISQKLKDILNFKGLFKKFF